MLDPIKQLKECQQRVAGYHAVLDSLANSVGAHHPTIAVIKKWLEIAEAEQDTWQREVERLKGERNAS